MTHILDHLINASLWAGLAYLAVGFVAYTIKRRSSNAVPVSQDAAPEAVAPQVITDPVAEAIAQIEVAYRDVIVPFKRPVPHYSDADLIQMAKRAQYPGAKKWSFNRKLSAKVRAELLQLIRQSA